MAYCVGVVGDHNGLGVPIVNVDAQTGEEVEVNRVVEVNTIREVTSSNSLVSEPGVCRQERSSLKYVHTVHICNHYTTQTHPPSHCSPTHHHTVAPPTITL